MAGNKHTHSWFFKTAIGPHTGEQRYGMHFHFWRNSRKRCVISGWNWSGKVGDGNLPIWEWRTSYSGKQRDTGRRGRKKCTGTEPCGVSGWLGACTSAGGQKCLALLRPWYDASAQSFPPCVPQRCFRESLEGPRSNLDEPSTVGE